ncbi:MAG: hypothetical protein ACOCUI_02030 [bacterium]
MLDWISRQYIGPFLYIDGCVSGRSFIGNYKKFRSNDRFISYVNSLKNCTDLIYNGNVFNDSFVIVRFENQALSDLKVFSNFLEEEKTLGHFKIKKNIIVLRDPYNTGSSIINYKNKTVYKTPDHIKKWIKLWIMYAKEFCGETNYIKDNLNVNYNLWFQSKVYRKKISKNINGKFTDESLDVVTDAGGGSSFSGILKNGEASSMKVLERWKENRDNELFKIIRNNKEIKRLSNKIFNMEI